MRKQITRISVLQTSKIVTLLYIVFSLIYVPIGFLMMFFGGREVKIMGLVYIGMPLLMGLLGFIFVAVGALVYNLLAKWVGGVEVTVTGIDTV